MGIIKAIGNAVGGALADSWLETIEPGNMSDTTVMTKGVSVRKGQNKKGDTGVISNGSVIHVYPNMMMLLIDGGRVVDYSAEEGYYQVSLSSAPSLFAGDLKNDIADALRETFERVKFGGVPSGKQTVVYINLQEIKGIKFGTRNPVNYFDNFYNAELFLRAFGTYSVRITDPLKFYAEAIPRNAEKCDITDINAQYMSEFLDAFASSINKLSMDGIRISFVQSKGRELSKYMADALDEEWRGLRGMEVCSVGIESISYDEGSQKLINMRNETAMMSDPSLMNAYMQKSVADGIKAAGGNAGGAAIGFMGFNAAQSAGAGILGAMNQVPTQGQSVPQTQQAPGAWTCSCGTYNTGNFCQNCGNKKPSVPTAAASDGKWFCQNCGTANTGKFCQACGTKKE
ncbi:MAG: SPFH domain-containing protein [Ruminococcus sp.]|jgi:membrane protease subunit (stomatin/prohibitin family)|nr:SPFH domain-containing protein [Ruminococcus sp.]